MVHSHVYNSSILVNPFINKGQVHKLHILRSRHKESHNRTDSQGTQNAVKMAGPALR